MAPELRSLIDQYQFAVATGINKLSSQLDLELPISNRDWAFLDIPQKQDFGTWHYYKHGYGCAVWMNGLYVDFDFGDDGQIDGFDLGRLMSFAKENNLEPFCSSQNDLESAFMEAKDLGDIVASDYILYYLAKLEEHSDDD